MSVRRKCICCGREYEYCPTCNKADQPVWKVTFCTERCKDLFNIVSAYNTKRIGKPDLQSFLMEHGITEPSKYNAPIRKVLEEVSFPSIRSYINNGSAKKEMVNAPLFRSRRRKKKNRIWNFA